MAMVVTGEGSWNVEDESWDEITERYAKTCETEAMTFKFTAQSITGTTRIMIPTDSLIRIESL